MAISRFLKKHARIIMVLLHLYPGLLLRNIGLISITRACMYIMIDLCSVIHGGL